MTIELPTQHPMPSHPRRRDGRAPLPAPEDRARLRQAWQLTDEQVAAAFGVTTATVRSWETGRTTPTGLRRAAYAAFLSGLAQGLAPSAAGAGTVPPAVHPPRRAARRRPERPTSRPQPRPALQPSPPPVSARHAPAAVALPVGAGPDPVTPARRRRLRVMAAAAGLWTVLLHVLITSPPPHM
ncbi:helix-turn-helix domain-containing protein [Streptomyces sp. NBC_00696]|uniref:helix-turn-helix domain-containing protein n=1 Tax=Streptomyces sp. NBC_00696 TaxID=2903672 RepID=UPI002E36CE3E|nr:helix-turn-helix domain-containing protein [Streptomyces sp. NBC_00696]